MSEALRVVSREQLQDVQRWTMPAMNVAVASAGPMPAPTLAELESIGEHARREGYEQGLAEGRAAARDELQGELQLLRGMCHALARPLADVDEAVERQLAELAMLVARGALQAELRLHPEHLLRIVRKAIAALPAATADIDIRVPPEAAPLLREGLPEAEEHAWHIVEDPQLKPGDCRIVSANSRIDAGTEARLAAMVAAALDEDLAVFAPIEANDARNHTA